MCGLQDNYHVLHAYEPPGNKFHNTECYDQDKSTWQLFVDGMNIL